MTIIRQFLFGGHWRNAEVELPGNEPEPVIRIDGQDLHLVAMSDKGDKVVCLYTPPLQTCSYDVEGRRVKDVIEGINHLLAAARGANVSPVRFEARRSGNGLSLIVQGVKN